MARIRSIHPGLFTDEAFMQASPHARLLMIGIWTEADDNGVFEWKPVVLKARIFPADSCDVAALLKELSDLGAVRKINGEKPLGAVRNFCKFQRPKSPKTVWDIDDDTAVYVALTSREESPEMGLKKRLLDRSGGKCAYCAAEIVAASKRHNSMEIDHDVPRALGGTDDEDNLVASCRACNRSKGQRSGKEFRAILLDKARDSSARSVRLGATPYATSEVALQMEDGGGREGGKKDKTGAERAGSDAYAFLGKVIKLKPDDLDEWRRRYSAIPDIQAELASLDDFYASDQCSPAQRKNWFIRCSKALDNRHQEAVRKRTEAAKPVAKWAI